MQLKRIQEQEEIALKQFQKPIDDKGISKSQALFRGVKFRSKELPDIITQDLVNKKQQELQQLKIQRQTQQQRSQMQQQMQQQVMVEIPIPISKQEKKRQ